MDSTQKGPQKRTSSTQEPIAGPPTKTAKTAKTATVNSAAGPIKDNGRPFRANAGKGGQHDQLEKSVSKIRPDLNKVKATGKGAHHETFSAEAPSNQLAPPSKSHQGASSGLNRSKRNPQTAYRPSIPEPPLTGPTQPSAQMNILRPFQQVLTPQDDSFGQLQRESFAQPQQTSYNQESTSNGFNEQNYNLGPADIHKSAQRHQVPPRQLVSDRTSGHTHHFHGHSYFSSEQNVINAHSPDSSSDRRYTSGLDNYHGEEMSFTEQLHDENPDYLPVNPTASEQSGINYSGYSRPSGFDGQDSFDNDREAYDGNVQEEDQRLDSEHGSSDVDKMDEENSQVPHVNEPYVIYSVDEQSPDEHERAALRALHGHRHSSEEDTSRPVPHHEPQPEADISGEDVLNNHRKRNRATKPPNPQRLAQIGRSHNKANRQEIEVGTSDDASRSSDDSSVPVKPTKSRAPRNSKASRTNRNRDQQQIGHYPETWQAVIKEAQQEWLRHLIVSHSSPFPDRQKDLPVVKQIIQRIVAQRLNDVYSHTRAMDVCVFNEHSNWRASLRDTIPNVIRQAYAKEVNPPDDYSGGQKNAAILVKRQIQSIIDTNTFHINGKDSQGRTDNFNHPGIQMAVHAMFYTGPDCLAGLFPNDFSAAVPKSAVGLALVMLRHTLLEFQYNAGTPKFTKLEFTGKEQRPHYDKVMKSIRSTLEDPYHGKKFEDNRRKWATDGMELVDTVQEQEDVPDFYVNLD